MYPKVYLSDQQQAFLNQVAERSRQNYHQLLKDIRETELEIDSFGENETRIAHLAKLKSQCEQTEAALLPTLNHDQLVDEDQKAHSDLEAAESDLRTIENQKDKVRTKWQTEKVMTLRSRRDKLERLLKTKAG